MRISDWSSDVCSSDLGDRLRLPDAGRGALDPDELVLAGAVGDPQAADEQRPYADGLDDRDVLDAVPGLDAVGLAAQRHGGARLDQRHAPSLLAGEVDRKSTRLNSSH